MKFDKEIFVFYFTRSTVKAVRVGVSEKAEVLQILESNWQPENLSSILKEILIQLKTKTVRVLLGKDLAYLIQMSLPATIAKKDERARIYEHIQDVIPEEINEQDWDYKVTLVKDQKRQILAFMPVKSVFEKISQALQENECSVTAVEPEVIAQVRDRNPILGLALKDDLSGPDDTVLNLSVSKTVSKENQVPTISKLKWGVVFVGIAMLIIGVIYLFTKAQSQKYANFAVSPIPSILATPSPVADSTMATSSSFPIDEITVKVLNGSGVSGEASYVKKLLESAGFKSIETGNSVATPSTKTIVQMKEFLENTDLKVTIELVLSSLYDITYTNQLTASDSSDLLIIVGDRL